MKEALFFEALDNQTVICHLCPHGCRIADGQRGLCRARANSNGRLYSLVYAKVLAEHIDPIEKKPLFHFYPGSQSYSIATAGCNFRCRHCQNSDISQIPRDAPPVFGRLTSPAEIVSRALAANCKTISYTYTEPTIYFEYAYEVAHIASQSGLKNVFVTNGYINPQPLEKIAPYLHAANVDLKSFNESFYRNMCGAHLQPVLDSIRLYKQLGIWIEITTLLIPGHNDSASELRQVASFISEIDRCIPWHVTAFFPAYQLIGCPNTQLQQLIHARDIGHQAGLRYVYTGNVSFPAGEHTYCPACNAVLIQRRGFNILNNCVVNAACPHCRTIIAGVGL